MFLCSVLVQNLNRRKLYWQNLFSIVVPQLPAPRYNYHSLNSGFSISVKMMALYIWLQAIALFRFLNHLVLTVCQLLFVG